MALVYLLILAVVYIFLDLAMRKKLNTKMKKAIGEALREGVRCLSHLKW